MEQKSDQLSLAAILYEMLTKHSPYGEKYETAMDLKTFQRLKYIPARKYNPLVPQWLDRAMEKVLNIQPIRRYSSLSRWVTDLKRPNPNWLTSNENPLIEKNPIKTWQIISAIG